MTEPQGPTGPPESTDPHESTDPTPTEETMPTPTSASPPESDVVAGAGTTQTDTYGVYQQPTAGEEPQSGQLGTAGHRPTLGDGPTVTYEGPQQPEPPTGPRMRSIAWGLVLALLGVVVIAVGLGVRLDLQLVFIGILAVAGLTLLVGSLVSGSRKR